MHFLDGIEARRKRRDMVLSSAVAAGIVTPMQAWPEYFEDDQGDTTAFPSSDADMSGFRLEEATPESFEADLEAMVRASEQVTIREEPMPEPPRFPGVPTDIEWT